ncbi:MAG: Clp protease ClpX [Candidatus Magasanikbacteria bacterium GW2011_GWA2_45_39]|uniref:Clp protease ClpX n=1 Tax=Candidatus Magasanikbacteria bacterium GW2011_GWA2_45_39 TaxID=1619041 RepID=A0A0G1MHW4_9BACT|nr:MAG: Clp protease ClpX [Candidatus Magasanikbacteria bacterium GW2011_GWA2_45_39]
MDNDIFDLLSEHLKQSISMSLKIAEEMGAPSASPAHLWYTLALERGSVASEILRKTGIDTKKILATLRAENSLGSGGVSFLRRKMKKPIRLSDEMITLLTKSLIIAAEYHHTFVGTEHAVLALAENTDALNKKIIKKHAIDTKTITEYAMNVLHSNTKFPEIVSLIVPPHEEKNSQNNVKTKEKENTKITKKKTPALDFFTMDLTTARAQKTIDPVIGRAEEIDRLITILCRRTKNNPVLLGDPGVGKTAIAEGLAKKIAEGNVPEELQNKRILSLDMGLLIAGTTYRGEFEARLKQVVEEIKNDPHIIVFIDELHTIVGAGSNSGSLDAANMLKPALARGYLRCIGATTSEEYKKHIESDPALERRFQPIVVKEPNTEETLAILRGIAPLYETFHNVLFTEQTLNAAVELADSFLTDKFFPDKAIDLLDEAATKKHLSKNPNPVFTRIKKIDAQLEKAQDLKRRAIEKELFKEALEIKASEKELEQIRAELLALASQKKSRTARLIITPNDIANVISRITGFSVSSASIEASSMAQRKKLLLQRIIGQDETIDTILTALERSRLGLHDPSRPIASFIMVGPSGVGKTELAKQLAETIFHNRQSFVRIDMSEFAEGFHVSKLIGSPAGYVGYKESNTFTDRIKRHPHSIILFDEIDKAHTDVFNLFLQILDEGFLTDAVGKKINFRNTIILMTTTVGAENFKAPKLGFQSADSGTLSSERVRASIINELKTRFHTEFLNRVNNILIMKPLSSRDIERIVELEIDAVRGRLKKRGVSLLVDDSVVSHISKEVQARDQGARAVRAVVEELIVTPMISTLAEKKKQKKLTVTMLKEKIIFED